MATSGVKSSRPALGIIRRKGARMGSVTWCRISTSLLVGAGENQDRIARNIMAIVRTSHRSSIKRNKKVIMAYPPSLWALW